MYGLVHRNKQRMRLASFNHLVCDFEDDIESDRHPEGKARNADYQPNRSFLDAKDISKQIRDRRPRPWAGRTSPPEVAMNTPSRTTRVTLSSEPRCSLAAARTFHASAGGISSSLGIELFPKSAKILRLAVHNWEHSAKEEKVARLHRFDVSAKQRRGGRELNAKCPAAGDLHRPGANL
jgi:hypothetical protein